MSIDNENNNPIIIGTTKSAAEKWAGKNKISVWFACWFAFLFAFWFVFCLLGAPWDDLQSEEDFLKDLRGTGPVMGGQDSKGVAPL